ncbi:leucine-rich repeat-containing protein 41 [Austrofundulus limnaeus]|uniref:Leucine-rich repeat-containing protein 41 n=1 Tax=Austrofundulus limnaeus TaxID=52670 RepID=A0A2I4B728_AUSLI|nr:PREDICTED: leucine-rich repeat-containing protein 41 [Austrofundulus limnaeus]
METTKTLEVPRSLRETCFQAIRTHFSALGANAVLAIPASLIRDLLPHLTVCQLDEVQPALNDRGISTYSGWFSILQDFNSDYCPLEFNTEEKAKHEVMRYLFPLVFYGFKNHYIIKNSENLKNESFLWAAASCNTQFWLKTNSSKPLQTLTSDRRPLLTLLEEHIRTIILPLPLTLSESNTRTALYILHRLLDHGSASQLVLHSECRSALPWLLHGRGSQYVNPALRSLFCSSCILSPSNDVAGPSLGPEDEELHVSVCKRSRLDSENSEESNLAVDPHVLCSAYGQGAVPSAGPCPWGQITHLDLRKCGSESFRCLIPALPTFFCLRSLTLHSSTVSGFREADVLNLAAALKELSDSCCSSLSDLSVSVLPRTELMKTLLDAFPGLTSLYLEIQSVLPRPRFIPDHPPAAAADSTAELMLEKLTVKITEDQTDLRSLTYLLSRSPRLTSLHLSGIRPTGSTLNQLLTTLSESNCCLRVLRFEDVKLCDCLPEVLNILRTFKLEELTLNDCRLLEKCSNEEERLLQLVAAFKQIPSLLKLSVAQNRLAKNVCILAELFSGPGPSSVKHLNISSNFILPPYLLEFAESLRAHPPACRLILDLRQNPADRDFGTWTRAVQRLQPIALLLTERWKSTDMMVDHVSNM